MAMSSSEWDDAEAVADWTSIGDSGTEEGNWDDAEAVANWTSVGDSGTEEGDWDDAEAVAHWTSVGDSGTEEGLRKAGCSDKCIAETLQYLRGAEIFDSSDDVHSLLSTTKDGPAVLLGTVGRGNSSRVRTVKLTGYRGGFPRNKSEATALSVNLRSNSNITTLVLDANLVLGSLQGCKLLATALKTNSFIKHLSMPGCNIEKEALTYLTDGLKGNETLVTLDLSRNSLLDSGVDLLAGFLRTNVSLKSLNLFRTHCGFEGANHMAFALEGNNTLEVLDFGGNHIKRSGLNRLLEPLSQNVSIGEAASSSDSPKNTTLKTLRISLTEMSDFPAENVARMIRTNKNLSTLHLRGATLSPEDWKLKIFASLMENETLKELDLSSCGGLSRHLCDDLMYWLQSSGTGLERVVLDETDLSYAQGRVDEELRMNLQYRGLLRDHYRVQTTSGRLVLCGFEFAGKTAIRKTMERIEQGTTPLAHELRMRWKKVIKKAPGLRRFLFGKDAHRELTTRTRGFDISVLRKQGNLASVWDFAGQIEYYALHDYLFPNTVNSCFLYVCSSRCPPDYQSPKGKVKDNIKMKDEFEYWMRFIASNSRPHQVGESHSQRLPQVRFVLTQKDTLDSASLNTSKQYAVDVVRDLKQRFQAVIALCEDVEVVNAHSSEDVEHLILLTKASLEETLKNQTEYEVCKEVRTCLENWSAENPSKPLLSFAELRSILDDQVKHLAPIPYRDAKLYGDNGMEAVLAYLNDIGVLIFPKGLGFIVANPRWFGVGVLGSLINAFGGVEDINQRRVMCTRVSRRPIHFFKLHHEEGFAQRRNIESLLETSLQLLNLQTRASLDALVKLMIHLELCFEKEPGKVDSPLFIPALFDNEMETASGIRKLQWKLQRGESLIYLGRRLECEDKYLTFLTPGFFPRLQVHLRNYIHQHNWTGNPGFEVGRDLICFAENGIEVLVEYSGSIDYFVDILVRSSKPHAVALQFVEEHVVKTIVQFCASPQGCQGVLLVEAVIRPVCVEFLHFCMDRKAHSVLVTDLRAHLGKDNSYEHTWRKSIKGVKGTDFARDLLEGKGSHMSFLRSSQPNFIPEVVSRRASASSQSQGEKYSNGQRNVAEMETLVDELQGLRRGITQQELYRFKQEASTHQSSQSYKSFGIKGHCKQVNDSLIELYRPDNIPTIQIVFFHGLQMGDYSDAHLSTWQSGDGSTIWPRTWLIEEISGAHVLSVSYGGGLRPSSDGIMDMYNIRENLLSDLLQEDVGQVPHCPVVLVGHSIGGLVIKELCIQAHDEFNNSLGSQKAKLETFLQNIGGIFYYSTPHHGSRVVELLAENISSPLLTYFETLSKDTARLNNKFDIIRKVHYKDWLIAGLGEGLPTELGPFEAGVATAKVVIVPEPSARSENFNVVEYADHFTVCRPLNRTVRSFTKLRDFVSQISSKASDCKSETPCVVTHPYQT